MFFFWMRGNSTHQRSSRIGHPPLIIRYLLLEKMKIDNQSTNDDNQKFSIHRPAAPGPRLINQFQKDVIQL
ncbi:hypothetical protein OIU78_000262 [Salix suchowensis]|nr:hypothetical protein OIU78_000262 [Salix suchowensis]